MTTDELIPQERGTEQELSMSIRKTRHTEETGAAHMAPRRIVIERDGRRRGDRRRRDKQRRGMFDLKRPCAKCPFRTDIPAYLNRERAREIVAGLERGTFSCHQTVDYDALEREEYEEYVASRDGEQFCAGALIMMHKQGKLGQMARLGERFGMYDAAKLNMDAPVFDSAAVFIESQHGGRMHEDTPEGEEHETCHCAGPGCEWPAGYMTASGAVCGDTPPEALGTCDECSEPTCDNCIVRRGEEFICLDCIDDE